MASPRFLSEANLGSWADFLSRQKNDDARPKNSPAVQSIEIEQAEERERVLKEWLKSPSDHPGGPSLGSLLRQSRCSWCASTRCRSHGGRPCNRDGVRCDISRQVGGSHVCEERRGQDPREADRSITVVSALAFVFGAAPRSDSHHSERDCHSCGRDLPQGFIEEAAMADDLQLARRTWFKTLKFVRSRRRSSRSGWIVDRGLSL